MNEILKTFFLSGDDEQVQELIFLLLKTFYETVEKLSDEEIIMLYEIDNINNLMYNNDCIKELCTLIKQNHLMHMITW